MRSLLRTTQKYGVLVALVIGLALLAAFADQDDINDTFGSVVGVLASLVFVSVPDIISSAWGFLQKMPLVILALVGCSIFFTLRFNFINILGFKHAIDVVLGKHDNPNDPGEVSHFQALSSALSATVGLGNIAGVAVAVTLGGPGAIFWMMVTAFFGMSSKFAECTLGQMYRRTDARGEVQGGPMVYLRDGLAELGWPSLGKYLSIIFAVLCIGGSFGGGNMFQANQSFQGMAGLLPWLDGERATGQVIITAQAPFELPSKRHLVRAIRPAREHVEGQPEVKDEGKALMFLPALDWTPADSAWTRDARGLSTTTLPVRARHSGAMYNLEPGAIAQLQIGVVRDGQVSFETPVGATITNVAPLSGGTGNRAWLFGLVLAAMVGVVIIGGIKSIGRVAEKIVPLMCGIYLLGALWIVLMNIEQLGGAIATIWREAFNPRAGIVGGFVAVFIQGVRRAAFSSEAGVGSAAIAHAAAKTNEPVREGIVALLEPFIDTIVVCFMTGMVIVISGVYADPANSALEGIELTSAAFGSGITWFPMVLSVAVFLFAYSTMISWSYYGERCWTFLFGSSQSMIYRALFLVFVWLGCVSNMQNVIDFSDLMILAMAFPNLIGVVFLSGKLKVALDRYWTLLREGRFDHPHTPD